MRQRRSGHPSLIHYLCGCFQDFVTFLPTRPRLTTWYLHLCPMYGGIITKKLRECPCLCRQYFISDIKGAALVDNDEGRAGQSILSSGPWGVVKTWIENNCQMLKMPRDGAMEQKYILLSCRLATHWILWCKGWAFVGTPGYLLSDKTSENSELMRRKTSRREIYFVARIFSLKMLFSQQRLGIVFFSVLSVFYTDTHQCSEWKRKC